MIAPPVCGTVRVPLPLQADAQLSSHPVSQMLLLPGRLLQIVSSPVVADGHARRGRFVCNSRVMCFPFLF
jgi:hypothetical protein